jgi:UDP-N-acetyl-D-glucosamine dehydrogenase
VLGVAFKPNIDDARNSPAERVMELLLKEAAHVVYHDPYVPHFEVGGDVVLKNKVKFESIELNSQALADADCVVIVTGHQKVDYQWIVQQSRLVIDTVNATRSVAEQQEKVLRLGAPYSAVN